MKNSLIILITLSMFSCGITNFNAQNKVNASTTYIHNAPVSFRSKMVQNMSSLLGARKVIENRLNTGDYEQDATPITKSVKKAVHIEYDTIRNRVVWTLKPKKNASEKVVLFLHGGAYYFNISKLHWVFVEELSEKTNATFVVPNYPLAPHTKCEAVIDYVDELYANMLTKYSGKDIIIMGDSAGGGLSLALSLWLKKTNKPLPSEIILLAPWLDVTMSNPDIINTVVEDKILGIKGLKMAGEGYAGETDVTDYRVSPINGDFSNLPEVSIFIGTHDLFIADSRKLKDKMIKSGVRVNYFEYPKMFHDWAIVKAIKEGRVAINQIAELIKS